MVCVWGKKRLCPVLTAYLALAVMGAFTLSTAESLRFDDPEKDQLKGSYTAIHHTIDWLLENTGVMVRANSRHNSSLSNGIVREFMPAGICSTAVYAVGSFSQAGKNQVPLNKKLEVPLKLRI